MSMHDLDKLEKEFNDLKAAISKSAEKAYENGNSDELKELQEVSANYQKELNKLNKGISSPDIAYYVQQIENGLKKVSGGVDAIGEIEHNLSALKNTFEKVSELKKEAKKLAVEISSLDDEIFAQLRKIRVKTACALDAIANEIEPENKLIALAIDRVSDILNK
jgi:chromosome segregation ATPase